MLTKNDANLAQMGACDKFEPRGDFAGMLALLPMVGCPGPVTLQGAYSFRGLLGNLMLPKSLSALLLVAALTTGLCRPASAQDATRDATRELVRAQLDKDGPTIGVEFRQSTKNLYNFVGTLQNDKGNAESLEIIVSVTATNVIGFRIYPHYKGGYINLEKARDKVGLMEKLLYYSDQNFLFWGADDTHDVFAGYTITLESGYPSEAMNVVIRSIPTLDKFVGEMRPVIDGSAAP